MKKTLILSLALALGITTVCAASPLKNYNAGKVAKELLSMDWFVKGVDGKIQN